jgi:hypothetical protein
MNDLTHWEVRVEGAIPDLQHLATHFTSGNIVVIKDGNSPEFRLTCDRFRSLTSSDAVFAASKAVAAILSGVLRFTRNSSVPVTPSVVYRRHSDGSADVFVCLTDRVELTAEDSVVLASGDVLREGVHVVTATPPISVSLMSLALGNDSVSRAMGLLARSDAFTWVGLYRIHEVIEDAIGGEKALIKCGFGSALQLKRFKHSSNSVAVAGDLARHGKELTKPPKNPMSLEEAKAYVMYALQAWLDSGAVPVRRR